MISAVSDSCSVRLDKVNGKVYKFHALVFSQDAQGNNKEAYLDREIHRKNKAPPEPTTRSILSQQPKTEWKCAYNELLSGKKDIPRQKDDLMSGPIRKKSKTSQDTTNDSEAKIDRQRVRFKGVEESSEMETPTCPTCRQVIAKDTKDYDSLMEKSKEELVTMVMNLSLNLQNRRRKHGYCPSEKDIAQLDKGERAWDRDRRCDVTIRMPFVEVHNRMQLNINKPEQTPSKTRPTRTRRRLSTRKRLTSI